MPVSAAAKLLWPADVKVASDLPSDVLIALQTVSAGDAKSIATARGSAGGSVSMDTQQQPLLIVWWARLVPHSAVAKPASTLEHFAADGLYFLQTHLDPAVMLLSSGALSLPLQAAGAVISDAESSPVSPCSANVPGPNVHSHLILAAVTRGMRLRLWRATTPPVQNRSVTAWGSSSMHQMVNQHGYASSRMELGTDAMSSTSSALTQRVSRLCEACRVRFIDAFTFFLHADRILACYEPDTAGIDMLGLLRAVPSAPAAAAWSSSTAATLSSHSDTTYRIALTADQQSSTVMGGVLSADSVVSGDVIMHDAETALNISGFKRRLTAADSASADQSVAAAGGQVKRQRISDMPSSTDIGSAVPLYSLGYERVLPLPHAHALDDAEAVWARVLHLAADAGGVAAVNIIKGSGGRGSANAERMTQSSMASAPLTSSASSATFTAAPAAAAEPASYASMHSSLMQAAVRRDSGSSFDSVSMSEDKHASVQHLDMESRTSSLAVPPIEPDDTRVMSASPPSHAYNTQQLRYVRDSDGILRSYVQFHRLSLLAAKPRFDRVASVLSPSTWFASPLRIQSASTITLRSGTRRRDSYPAKPPLDWMPLPTMATRSVSEHSEMAFRSLSVPAVLNSFAPDVERSVTGGDGTGADHGSTSVMTTTGDGLMQSSFDGLDSTGRAQPITPGAIYRSCLLYTSDAADE